MPRFSLIVFNDAGENGTISVNLLHSTFSKSCINLLVFIHGAKMKRLRKIFYWVLIIFTLYLIFEIIRKIAGGNLGFEELVVGLLIANMGYSFYLNLLFSEHIGWHKDKKINDN